MSPYHIVLRKSSVRIGHVVTATVVVAAACLSLKGAGGEQIFVQDETPHAVPPPALAAGYLTPTFGPNLTLGGNWHAFSFYNVRGVLAVQNADGSITIPGPSGDDFGAQLCTATAATARGQASWTGKVFGAGGYFEVTMSFTGPNEKPGPSFWANDIESMSAGSKKDLMARQWPEQPAGYGNWIEVDVAEFNSRGLEYGIAMHNWYDGRRSPIPEVNTRAVSGSPISVPVGTDFSRPHKYGFLWIPATPTTKGQASWYFDDVQVGRTVTWNQWRASLVPPPEVGTSAFSVLDTRHLAFILGTGSSNAPLTIYSASVWQRSSTENVTR